jgi:hypothetical protein
MQNGENMTHVKSEIVPNAKFEELQQEIGERNAIFVSSINTSKRNQMKGRVKSAE